MNSIRTLIINRRWLVDLRDPSELALVEATSGAASSQGNATSVTFAEVADEAPVANEIPSSIANVQLYVHQFKYLLDECLIAYIFLDMNGQVGFFQSYPSGKCTSSHGCWLSVSDFRGFKLEFDPICHRRGCPG